MILGTLFISFSEDCFVLSDILEAALISSLHGPLIGQPFSDVI